jgi:hypothetical protein
MSSRSNTYKLVARVDEPTATFTGGNPIGGVFSSPNETIYGTVVGYGECVHYGENELVPVVDTIAIEPEHVSMEQIDAVVDYLVRKNGALKDRKAFDAFIAMLVKFITANVPDMPPQECVPIIELYQQIINHKDDIIYGGGRHIVDKFDDLIIKLEIVLHGSLQFGCTWKKFFVKQFGKIAIERDKEMIIKKISGDMSDSPYRGCPCCSWDPYKPVVCGIICTVVSDDEIEYNFADYSSRPVDSDTKLRVYISSAGFMLDIDPATDRPIWPNGRLSRENWQKEFNGNDKGNIEIRIRSDGQNTIVQFVEVREYYELDLESFNISKDDPVSFISVNNIACVYTTDIPPIEYFVDSIAGANTDIEEINQIIDNIARQKIADAEAKVRARDDANRRAEAARQLAEANTIALYKGGPVDVHSSQFFHEFKKPTPDGIVGFPIPEERKAALLKKIESLHAATRLAQIRENLEHSKLTLERIKKIDTVADINKAFTTFTGVKTKTFDVAKAKWDRFLGMAPSIDLHISELDALNESANIAFRFIENIKSNRHGQETFHDYVRFISESYDSHHDMLMEAEAVFKFEYRVDKPAWYKAITCSHSMKTAILDMVKMWKKKSSNDSAILERISNDINRL